MPNPAFEVIFWNDSAEVDNFSRTKLQFAAVSQHWQVQFCGHCFDGLPHRVPTLIQCEDVSYVQHLVAEEVISNFVAFVSQLESVVSYHTRPSNCIQRRN